MTLVELTENIIKDIIDDDAKVTVKEIDNDSDIILIQILTDDKTYPYIIGKGGKTINSIRAIVQASSSLKDNKYVKIVVDKE